MFQSLLDTYRASHTHPVNKALHTIGIPAIVVSLPLFFWNWRVALGVFAGGWVLQFIGHAVEGTAPVFLRDPRALLVAPFWWAAKLPLPDMGLLLLRLVPGAGLALVHGLGKVPPPVPLVEGVAALGFPLPLVFAWAAGLAEFAGGLCMATGLFARPAAFFVACTMGVAAFGVHAADPFAKKEMALLYLTVSLAVLCLGPGRVSLDHLRRRRTGGTGFNQR